MFDETLNSNSNLSEDMSKGIKFDGKNHNWLILEQYIALSFSFLTFVIKEK